MIISEKKKSTDLCFIVQARLGSSRLPNKMILPFFKQISILEIILEKLKSNFPKIQIILAIPISIENDSLETIAKRYGCVIYRGSEENVLERFIHAASFFKYNKIIRVCADNPFLDICEMHRLIKFSEENVDYDYISFIVNNKPSIKSHFGFWSEYVKLDTLKSITTKTNDVLYNEHVTNYIYGNPSYYKIKLLDVRPILNKIEDIRMTIDTLDDFNMLSDIYNKLNKKYDVTYGIDEIIEFLDFNSKYRIVMKNQIEINSK